MTDRALFIGGPGSLSASTIQSLLGRDYQVAALVDAPQAIGKDYTCGHPTFTTHTASIHLFAHALGVDAEIIHIPGEVIIAHPDPEARSCLLHALTRFNVAFSMDRFLRDFPEFRWAYALDAWTQHVVEWNVQHGLLDALEDEIFDDRVIASWQKCMQSYAR